MAMIQGEDLNALVYWIRLKTVREWLVDSEGQWPHQV
jgi:hypothetical protein